MPAHAATLPPPFQAPQKPQRPTYAEPAGPRAGRQRPDQGEPFDRSLARANEREAHVPARESAPAAPPDAHDQPTHEAATAPAEAPALRDAAPQQAGEPIAQAPTAPADDAPAAAAEPASAPAATVEAAPEPVAPVVVQKAGAPAATSPAVEGANAPAVVVEAKPDAAPVAPSVGQRPVGEVGRKPAEAVAQPAEPGAEIPQATGPEAGARLAQERPSAGQSVQAGVAQAEKTAEIAAKANEADARTPGASATDRPPATEPSVKAGPAPEAVREPVAAQPRERAPEARAADAAVQQGGAEVAAQAAQPTRRESGGSGEGEGRRQRSARVGAVDRAEQGASSPAAPAPGATPEAQRGSQPLFRLEGAAPGAQSPPTLRTSGREDVDESAFAASVSRGLGAAVNQRGGTVTMRLQPETLGSLTIRMEIVRGVVDARFEASTPEARELLSKHIETLRSSLEARGLSVEKLQVTLAGGASQGGHATGQQSGGQHGGSPQQPTGSDGRGFSHDAGGQQSRGHDGGFDPGRHRRDADHRPTWGFTPEAWPAGADAERGVFSATGGAGGRVRLGIDAVA